MISIANVVAIGVTEQGERTLLGGASEDHQFWTSILLEEAALVRDHLEPEGELRLPSEANPGRREMRQHGHWRARTCDPFLLACAERILGYDLTRISRQGSARPIQDCPHRASGELHSMKGASQ